MIKNNHMNKKGRLFEDKSNPEAEYIYEEYIEEEKNRFVRFFC